MSEPQTTSASPPHPFIAMLEQLKASNDRGALATLRRGLSDINGDFGLYRIIGRAIPPSEIDDTPYRLVACLFAAHQHHDDAAGSLGSSTGVLRSRLGDGASSLDIRFTALLNADTEDLPVRLRHLFSQLVTNDVAVNYGQLLTDLKYWSSQKRRAQRRWARDYWAPEQEEQTQAEQGTTAPAA